jgi:hypothetical protein
MMDSANQTGLQGTVGVVTNGVSKVSGWVDRLFSNFEGYSKGYSELLVYALLIWVLGKMLKIKINLGK